ncbi:hypothetical protein [uncultured Pedobacter sp.]|uniref:hypothetical protein n=1 Tax=uncultured Pedobacter sp. TaxID=246139 RepID=UPI0025F674DD|nr:hypothetical protein [uncultured Pedobacter sp.]
MSNNLHIKKFVAAHNIHHIFIQSFKSLLDQNTCEVLDITDKNISVDTENIEAEVGDLNTITFKSTVHQNNNKIGYYKLVFTTAGELMDDFFVIQ